MEKRQSLYQHFAPEEREFVEKIIDLCQQVELTYSYRLTTFLNPREAAIVTSLAAHFQLSVFSSQEYLQTEFSRLILAPDYYELQLEDFEISALEVSYPVKYYTLTHPQILGTLLHQLGIRREYLGDILPKEDLFVIILDQKFGELATGTISKIGRIPVNWSPKEWSSLTVEVASYRNIEILLSSLRLDKVVSSAFKLSRFISVKLIESGKVKVDYREAHQVGKTVEIGQLISVRGYGRVRLRNLNGYSKQGKMKVEIELIKK